jgi:hypothetical protein
MANRRPFLRRCQQWPKFVTLTGALEDLPGVPARYLQPLTIGNQIRHPEQRHTRLSGAQKITRTTHLEIGLGHSEPVRGAAENVQPPGR